MVVGRIVQAFIHDPIHFDGSGHDRKMAVGRCAAALCSMTGVYPVPYTPCKDDA
jgi:hypothetical protein